MSEYTIITNSRGHLSGGKVVFNIIYIYTQGVLQTVKDWLTPSKWTNPWNEEDEEMMEGEGEVPVVQQEVTETPIPQQQGKPLEDNRPATTGPNDNTQTVR